MRERVLAALREAGESYLSGEELSLRLGVSRTAIFKHMESLRSLGYRIEAQPRKGYRLVEEPDIVTPEAIGMTALPARLGRRIEYLAAVGSTNEVAKRLAREGAAEGTIVVAEEQTAGKGRLGRSWASPPGAGIWLSVLLRPDGPAHHTPRLTLVAAVAVAEAVREVTGLAAGIKWPNDLQLGGRKFCGILTELEAEMERVAFVVVGIGINVNHVPDAFRPGATSLAEEMGRPVKRAPLIGAVLRAFERWYGRPFPEVLGRWKELSVTLGREITVLPFAGGEPLYGRAVDLDEEGALLVESGGEIRRVVAGEVSIR